MKPIGTRSIILREACGILTACAIGGSAFTTTLSMVPAGVETNDYMSASDRMSYWHEEARELQAMATQRTRESQVVLNKYPGPGMNQFVQHMQRLAHQLQEAADYANTQAHDAEREIPPDMLAQLQSVLH